MSERLVPREHLARRVQRVVERFELTAVEARFSALGQNGFAPRQLLGVWLYASLVGLHQGTRLARALQTDCALRWLSGGHCISVAVLNRFRAQNGALFLTALEQTVRWAVEEGLVRTQQLGIDSVRLRAHASRSQVRVRSQSERRLKQLSAVDVESLCASQREQHPRQVRKHEEAVRLCEQRAQASVVLSNPRAALMQFPGNGVHPGHRLTVVASGVTQRLVVGVLLTASGNDKGHLEEALQQTRRVLHAAGVPLPVRLQVAGDSGYWSEEDLRFAALHHASVDVLLNPGPATGPLANKPGMFPREAFELQHARRAVVCPAGRPLRGPVRNRFDGCDVYFGVGCRTCHLRPRCTRAKCRTFTVRWEYESLLDAMQARMKQPDAKARYQQRMATVEPVFASLQQDMGFRRLSSRHSPTIDAEVFLKLLAHNVSRLLTRSRLFCVFVLFVAPASPPASQPG
ncbi:transposase [Corallococcus exercitus]|uniref:IS5/IS1182 family transposase n=1 Tax=Corallococcus exercitus TaxID=2316736 RepID=A0A7Y4K1J8_9BACT|nr:transposase [Corallococcus exercitus]NOK15226.1 IS5/IS1182 family transposase [Corallococcus exercitus]